MGGKGAVDPERSGGVDGDGEDGGVLAGLGGVVAAEEGSVAEGLAARVSGGAARRGESGRDAPGVGVVAEHGGVLAGVEMEGEDVAGGGGGGVGLEDEAAVADADVDGLGDG